MSLAHQLQLIALVVIWIISSATMYYFLRSIPKGSDERKYIRALLLVTGPFAWVYLAAVWYAEYDPYLAYADDDYDYEV
ncbi:MAG TPA: hypothetical protein PK096_00930 [Candidatus Saccharibacteria bacterium]|nr:hypothetical protein [Candidatus Saccharibacteria bacterium]HRK93917.1 hypothetical protein [Candidatus Saccharibacteria bacterium]